MASPSPFIPTSRDVLLLISANAMGGGGLDSAFVFNRGSGAVPATGLVIDKHGSMCEVGAEEWAELQRLVSEASDAVMDGGGGCWMRRIPGSCAPNVFYDLGPAEEPAALGMFTISGHRREKQNISHKLNGVLESVGGIPSALLSSSELLPPSEKSCCRMKIPGRKRQSRTRDGRWWLRLPTCQPPPNSKGGCSTY
ncbi:hypothetical protein DFH09DRAFT_1121677, partial [Mycena vulgaris]